MKTLATKAVVTSADGFYYREEHEWRNMDEGATAKFTDMQNRIGAYIAKAQSNKEDDGLVAALDSTIDGVVQPTLNVTGISYGELKKFQRFWHDLEGEVLKWSEPHDAKKDAERHAKHAKKHP